MLRLQLRLTTTPSHYTEVMYVMERNRSLKGRRKLSQHTPSAHISPSLWLDDCAAVIAPADHLATVTEVGRSNSSCIERKSFPRGTSQSRRLCCVLASRCGGFLPGILSVIQRRRDCAHATTGGAERSEGEEHYA